MLEFELRRLKDWNFLLGFGQTRESSSLSLVKPKFTVSNSYPSIKDEVNDANPQSPVFFWWLVWNVWVCAQEQTHVSPRPVLEDLKHEPLGSHLVEENGIDEKPEIVWKVSKEWQNH